MPRRKGQPRDTFIMPFPVRPDWPTIPPDIAFPDTPKGHGVMANLSTTAVFIPGYLIDYYDRRALISVGAELQNAELQIAAVDEAGNPLEQAAFVYLGNPHFDACMRLSSERREISGYLRKAQHLVLCCFGRKISDMMPVVPTTAPPTYVKAPFCVRHITMTLLLGELPP